MPFRFLPAPAARWPAVVAVWLSLYALPAMAGGPYDTAYHGARWMSSPADVRPFVLGRLVRECRKVSPWDLPYIRELGHLYYLEDKDFSLLVSSFPSNRFLSPLARY